MARAFTLAATTLPCRTLNHELATHPPFWSQLTRLFASATSNQFLLSGNIHDLVDASSVDDGGEPFVPFHIFLVRRLASRHHLPVIFDLGRGIRFAKNADRKELRSVFAGSDPKRAKLFDQACAASAHAPAEALDFLSELTRLSSHRPVSIVILYADLLLPAAEAAHMSDADRRRLALMRDWLSDPRFLEHNGAVFLIAETAAGVNARLRTLPHLVTVDVPLPDADDRKAFLKYLQHEDPVSLECTIDDLIRMSAGMTLTDMRGLIADARWRGVPVQRRDVLQVVNRLIRARASAIILISWSHSTRWMILLAKPH